MPPRHGAGRSCCPALSSTHRFGSSVAALQAVPSLVNAWPHCSCVFSVVTALGPQPHRLLVAPHVVRNRVARPCSARGRGRGEAGASGSAGHRSWGHQAARWQPRTTTLICICAWSSTLALAPAGRSAAKVPGSSALHNWRCTHAQSSLRTCRYITISAPPSLEAPKTRSTNTMGTCRTGECVAS